MLDKWSQPIFVGQHPPTTAGLARALGFKSRTSLWNYHKKKEFRETIDEAMLRIEEYTEQRLFDRDGANGAKFSLQFNFKGWNPDTDEANGAPAVNIICDIPRTPSAPAPNESGAQATATSDGAESEAGNAEHSE